MRWFHIQALNPKFVPIRNKLYRCSPRSNYVQSGVDPALYTTYTRVRTRVGFSLKYSVTLVFNFLPLFREYVTSAHVLRDHSPHPNKFYVTSTSRAALNFNQSERESTT